MVRVCKVMVQPWMAVSVRGCRGAAVPTSVPLLPVDRSVCVGGGIPVGFPVPRGGPHSAGVVVGMGGGLRASQSCTPPSRPRRTPAPQRALRGGNGPSPPLPPTSLPTGSSPGPAAAPSPLCFPPPPPPPPGAGAYVGARRGGRGRGAAPWGRPAASAGAGPGAAAPALSPVLPALSAVLEPAAAAAAAARAGRPRAGGGAVRCAGAAPRRSAPPPSAPPSAGPRPLRPRPAATGSTGMGSWGGGGHREPGRVREPGSSRCPPQPPPLCAGSVPAGPGGERGPAALRSGPDPREGPARTGGTDLRDPQTGTPQAPPPHLAPPPNP